MLLYGTESCGRGSGSALVRGQYCGQTVQYINAEFVVYEALSPDQFIQRYYQLGFKKSKKPMKRSTRGYFAGSKATVRPIYIGLSDRGRGGEGDKAAKKVHHCSWGTVGRSTRAKAATKKSTASPTHELPTDDGVRYVFLGVHR